MYMKKNDNTMNDIVAPAISNAMRVKSTSITRTDRWNKSDLFDSIPALHCDAEFRHIKTDE
jgi:hypothetical protein